MLKSKEQSSTQNVLTLIRLIAKSCGFSYGILHRIVYNPQGEKFGKIVTGRYRSISNVRLLVGGLQYFFSINNPYFSA